MRTKTLLLTAALVAAGVATSMAQSNVYSLNVVGYVNVPIQAGFNMVCNPLDVGDGQGNVLTNVIGGGNTNGTALPDSTFLYPWNGSGYGSIQQYIGSYGWFDPNSPDGVTITNKIPPGKAFFILCPSSRASFICWKIRSTPAPATTSPTLSFSPTPARTVCLIQVRTTAGTERSCMSSVRLAVTAVVKLISRDSAGFLVL